MIKVLLFKAKQWLNQAKKDYADQLQETQDDKRKELFGKYLVINHKKSTEALQAMLKETFFKSNPLLLALSGKEKIVKNGKVSPKERTKSKKERKESQ